MARHSVRRRVTREMLELGFLRASMHNILLWPSLCILAGLLMWGLIHSKLSEDKAAIEAAALKQATSLSMAYAEQLTRTIEHIDQITLNVKYEWEARKGIISLEDQARKGLYPVASHLYVAVIDRQGRIVSSTVLFPNGLDAAAASHLDLHRQKIVDGLYISKPAPGMQTQRRLIRFSRRLATRDGGFAGIVMVAVEPEYLASFYDESSFGKSDFLSVRTTSGVLLATKMGADIRSLSTIFRTPPTFALPQSTVRVPDDAFVDGQPRILAWQTLAQYPLLSLVGISEKDIFAGYAANAEDYRQVGLAGTAVLFVFGVFAIFFTAMLAWRKHQGEEIKATYRLVIEEGGEGFYMLRALVDAHKRVSDFVVLDCNERGAVVASLSKEMLVGSRLSELMPAELWQKMIEVCALAMQTGFYEDEYPVQQEGHTSWIQRRLVRSGDGVAATLRDITDKKVHEDALARLANVDALTTLPNRHWLTRYLPVALQRARDANALLALMFIDLDNFKNINDTRGHAAGDELLQSAAMRLRSVIRPSDSVARLGGDEFTIVLEHVDDHAAVVMIGERIVSAFQEPFVLEDGSRHTVHASIGISIFPDNGDNVETLLKNADIAMYEAKANGKANFQFFQAHLSENLINRLNVEHALRQALDQDEFVLHYQPRIDTRSGELRSMEALIRWKDPVRGMIPPNEFIPIAEDTGLIVPLGALVMDKVCAQIASWKALGLPVVPVSINVSFRQFGQSGSISLKSTLSSCMMQHGIAPDLIEIELTESCMMGEQHVVHDALSELQALGVELLVDDFGTGYSSLSQLQRLDLDVLKVDRAFTAELGHGIEGEVFYRAIISMAHALGMRVVAEGVETLEQLHVLQALSCNEVQGYFISRPLPASAIPSLLTQRFLFPASVDAATPVLA